MKGFSSLVIFSVACCVYGDVLSISKLNRMKLLKTHLDESNVVDYFLELLGAKVKATTKFNVVMDDPFSYADVLLVVEDTICKNIESSYQTLNPPVDWDKIKHLLNKGLIGKMNNRASFHVVPSMGEIAYENATVEKRVESLKDDFVEIGKQMGPHVYKTVVWIEAAKSKPECAATKDFAQSLVKGGQRVIIVLVSKESATSRQKRDIEGGEESLPEEQKDKQGINPSEVKKEKKVVKQKKPLVFTRDSPDYPVIFTLIAFVALIFLISIIAVSAGISQMDPGRDSIIYRMTSQRMKKDQ